jgi:hypothetical protein
VRLDAEQRDLVRAARIGMLALGGRLPMVSPAAFHLGGDAIWMTTSRHAAKVALARRDPRAAFLVPPTRGTSGILLQGLLEMYDPLSPRSQVRALLQGPGFALNLAGYALKNAAYIAGYLLDVPRIPSRWWPHNRLLLRLRPEHVGLVAPLAVRSPAAPHRIPGAPAQVAQAVARHPEAQLCWLSSGRPVLAGIAWAVDGTDVLAWLPGRGPRPARDGGPAALVVEHRHPFRATRMLGLCLRGRASQDPSARLAIARRYGGELPEVGVAVRLEATRLTWWRGFEGRSRTIPRKAASEQAAR